MYYGIKAESQEFFENTFAVSVLRRLDYNQKGYVRVAPLYPEVVVDPTPIWVFADDLEQVVIDD